MSLVDELVAARSRVVDLEGQIASSVMKAADNGRVIVYGVGDDRASSWIYVNREHANRLILELSQVFAIPLFDIERVCRICQDAGADMTEVAAVLEKAMGKP